MIEHALEHCVGTWRYDTSTTGRVVRCTRCHKSYPGTPEYRLACIEENYAGTYLRNLERMGTLILAMERAK